MKIALVVHDLTRGTGHGRYCLELARHLRRDHSFHVFANRFDDEAADLVIPRLVPAVRTTALASVLSFLPSAELMLRREAFDLIHAQGLSCWRADVITAHLCNAARYARTPVPSLAKKLFPALVVPLEKAFYRRNETAELIAISAPVEQEIKTCYDWKRHSHIIHHGVDTGQFTPADAGTRKAARAALGLPEPGWFWLFVGEAIKGLAAAIAQLPHFPNARLIGVTRSTPEEYEALAARLGVSDRIHLPGPATNMVPYYHAADLFVYPSDYDAFGLVVAEAMASGLPVVAGREIGAAAWIQHGINGFVCDPRDESALRASLVLGAAAPASVGRAARETALQKTWAACARQTEAVYQLAIRSKAARARA